MRLSSPAAVPALSKAARGARADDTRIAACRALGSIRTKEVIAPLAEILTDSRQSAEVRTGAAAALRQTGRPEALALLEKSKDEPAGSKESHD